VAAAGLAAVAAAQVILPGEDQPGAIHVVIAALDGALGGRLGLGRRVRHAVLLAASILEEAAGMREAGIPAELGLVKVRRPEM